MTFARFAWAALWCTTVAVIVCVLFTAVIPRETTLTYRQPSVPVRITLPRFAIDAPVRAGEYNEDNQSWTLSWQAAHFAVMTQMPNTKMGTTLIYAHNTKKLFRATSRIQKGDEAAVYTEDGATYVYVFTHETVVEPDDTSVFSSLDEGAPRLVLLTCGGFFNQTRRLLYFDFVKIL